MKLAVVGCGGTGSFLSLLLIKMCREGDTIFLVDQDKVEESNLDRQLFTPADVGQYKAIALLKRLNKDGVSIQAETYWFTKSTWREPGCFGFCCADNHPCRVQMLEAVDENLMTGCVILGNETNTASADYYQGWLEGSPYDPRVKYPDYLTDESGDPRMPCTGEEQIKTPQLAIANAAAAVMGVQMWWENEVMKKPDASPLGYPHHHATNGLRWTTEAFT